jgi:acyl-coenzyme A thioesterase PaaI-like protein
MTDSRTEPPDVEPLTGWTPVDPFPPHDASRSFVSGRCDDGRLRVVYFRRESDGMLVGRAWFGPGAEGPPGHAHGGSVAAVLDEAMGGAAWMAGHRVVAVRLSVDFRRMVPLGTDAILEAWVSGLDGRKILTRARLVVAPDTVLAEADGIFVQPLPDEFRAVIGLPPGA